MLHRFLRISGSIEIVAGAWVNIYTAWSYVVSWGLMAFGILCLGIEMPGLWTDGRNFSRKIFFRGPINWDFRGTSDSQGFLSGSRHGDDSPCIAAFMPVGVVKKNGTEMRDAFIRSNLTGERLPVKIMARDAYVPVSETNPLSKGAEVRGQVLFYDPDNPPRTGRQGLTEAEFMKVWGDFDFHVVFSDRELTWKFPWKKVSKHVDLIKGLLGDRIARRPIVTRKAQ